MTATRRPAAPKMREVEEWQPQFLDLAHMLGWQHMHVRRTIGKGRKWTTGTSVKGWPDLTLWHEGQVRLIFVELKSDDGRLSPDQEVVLASLDAAGQETYVFRPSDLELAARILRRKP